VAVAGAAALAAGVDVAGAEPGAGAAVEPLVPTLGAPGKMDPFDAAGAGVCTPVFLPPLLILSSATLATAPMATTRTATLAAFERARIQRSTRFNVALSIASSRPAK
jgi:hypothetical protein